MKKSEKKQLYLLIGLIAAFIAICVLVYFAFFGKTTKYNKLFDAAQSAYTASDFDEARDNAAKALKVKATPECYSLLSDIYLGQGNEGMAMSVLELGINAFPNEGLEEKLSKLKGGDLIKGPQGGGSSASDSSDSSIVIAGQSFEKNVRFINLAGMELTDADIASVAELTSLESLNISGNKITDLSVISSLSKLTFLDASSNNITDISFISGMIIKTLYLDNNPIEDFTPLMLCSSLRTLSIYGMEIEDKQFNELKEALPSCSVYADNVVISQVELGGKSFPVDIEELDLSSLNIDSLKGIEACTKLRVLNLRNNKIDDLSPLAELSSLEYLSLKKNHISDIASLSGLTGLETLDLSDNEIKDISALAGLNNLKTLYLDGLEISSFTPLAGLKSLEILGVSDTGLKNEHLDIIEKLTGLKKLNISDNKDLTANRFEELAQTLSSCEISHSDMLYIIKLGDKEYSSDSVEIDAEDCGAKSIAGLEKFEKLLYVDLSGNKLTDAGPLVKAEKLITLDLGGNLLSNVSFLVSLKSLVSLDLSSNAIEDITAVGSLSSLKVLYLSDNFVSDISALSGCTALETLDLSDNEVTDLTALSSLTGLEILKLDKNKITDLTPLYDLKELRELDISENSVKASEVKKLKEALPGCKITTDLDLTADDADEEEVSTDSGAENPEAEGEEALSPEVYDEDNTENPGKNP